MPYESESKKILGVTVPKQYDDLIPSFFIFTYPAISKFRRVQFTAKEDPHVDEAAMFVINHDSGLDVTHLLGELSMRYGVGAVPVVKKGLVDLDYREPETVKRSTGRSGGMFNSTGAIYKALIGRPMVSVIRTCHPVPVKRGENDTAVLTKLDRVLALGNWAIISGQYTRRPEHDLRQFGMGAAAVALRNPYTRIYNVGISGSDPKEKPRGPVVINIDESFRTIDYFPDIEDILYPNGRDDSPTQGLSRRSIYTLTLRVAQMMAEREAALVPYESRKEWDKNSSLLLHNKPQR